MKKLGKIFANTLIVVYALIAITVTVLLLSYNDYHFSVIGGYTFILVTDDELEDFGYEEGSLLLVKETKAKRINQGDYIFFYRTLSTTEFEVECAEVILKDETGGEYNISFVIDGNEVIESDEIIGSSNKLIEVPHLGTILSILESRYGYLFLIVVVSFIAFLYEIYELIMEIKYGEREEEDEEDDDDDYEEEEEEVIEKPKKKAATTTKKTTAKTATATKKSTTASKAPAQKTSSKATSTKATAAKSKTSATKTSAAKKTTTQAKATTTKKKTTQAKK